jgi:sugar phosphate isomerase/epimerase
MDKWGLDGLEVWGGGLPGRVKEIQDALKGTRVKISAICAGYKGVVISDQKSVRDEAVKSMKEILVAAGELGSTGLITVPAFNGQTKLDHVKGREILVDLLPELGDAAQKAGTRILLEPLNRGEAWFLRLLADAAAICRDVNHPAVCLMGDFYHMGIEETSDLGAFLSAGKYLHHVHLASRKRNLPGQDERSYVEGFKGLKWIGYQGYCSFECGVIGNRDVEIPKSVAFLKDQWEKAVI